MVCKIKKANHLRKTLMKETKKAQFELSLVYRRAWTAIQSER